MKKSHILYHSSVLLLRMSKITNNIWTHLVLHEQRKPVKVALWPEASNPKDANAIVIDMDYETRWIHVGYIASDLCKYLLLLQVYFVDVSVQHIRPIAETVT